MKASGGAAAALRRGPRIAAMLASCFQRLVVQGGSYKIFKAALCSNSTVHTARGALTAHCKANKEQSQASVLVTLAPALAVVFDGYLCVALRFVTWKYVSGEHG